MSQFIDESSHDVNLRLGDIINGFAHIVPSFDDFFTNGHEYRLDVRPQKLFVVLTPCCSIEDKIITVVPLKDIRYSFYSNPYFKDDMTRINRPARKIDLLPPKQAENISAEERANLELAEPVYGFGELFIYGEHPKLPLYQIKYKTNTPISTKYYMIDFKDAFTVKSEKIVRGNKYPKLLQLTIASRGELRNKLAAYYSRVPEEDEV
ncbi:MAG: hypothetical protein KAY50_07685 [Chitinophagaceae bacterium]|nr:hypothetical protein [Chitinophagaceae bacterium]